MYNVYPETDQAPTLDFIWRTPNLEMDEIARVTPYCVLEEEKILGRHQQRFNFTQRSHS